MTDVLGLVAGPGHVLLAGREGRSDRVETFHPRRTLGNALENHGAHAHHHGQAQRDVGGVRQFNAELRHRGIQDTHREGHDVECAPAHGPGGQVSQGLAHLARVVPVVGGTRILGVGGADKGS